MKVLALFMILAIWQLPAIANRTAGEGAGVVLLAAAEERKDRRDERGRSDERQDKRDCRQEEGVVGDDKRECKQEEVHDGVRGNRGPDDDPEN